MTRKTKEELEEKDTKKKVTNKKATSKVAEKPNKVKKTKNVKKSNKVDNPKEVEKTKKVVKSKKATQSKEVEKPKTVAKLKSEKVSKTAKVDKASKTEKANNKKESKKTVGKKATVISATKKDEKIPVKKSSSKKSATKSSTTSKTATKRSTTKKATTAKVNAEITPITPIEYYDLPYRYNETVVKVLAQTPNTLFAYWDISDDDRKNFEETYGKLFFYNTRPVLIVHNLTENYTFEIDIDDFANNWYIHVNDTKCKYAVELGRRPKYEQYDAIPVNYLNVAFSNTIEIPNDHILFFKENDRIYFKNIRTNKITEKIFKAKKDSNIVKGIYKNYNLLENEDRFDFQNPSSNNPTSNVF